MLNRFCLVRWIAGFVLAAGLALGGVSPKADAAFEGPLTFNARDFLVPLALANANYTIDPIARNDGLMNHYRLSSPFGALEATGNAVIRERAREMDAIAVIRQIKKTDAFMNGLGAAINGPLQASKTLITKPVQTIGNLGDTAKEMVDDLMSAIGNFGKKDSDDDSAMLKDLIGYNKAKRELAFRLGVDPYSSNPYLQEELGDLAWANFAGGATIDVAISAATVGGVGATVSAINVGAATGGIFLTKSLTSLTNLNSKYLAGMGLEGVAADPFLFHAKYSVSRQTLLVLALGAMQGVPGRADFIHLATGAQNEDQTRFYQRTAEIMGAYHQQVRPVIRVMVNNGWAFLKDADGRIVLPVPADYMAWTPRTAAQTQALPATQSRTMWTTGFVSPTMRSELAAQRIAIEEKIFSSRLADKIAIVEPGEARENFAAPVAAPANGAIETPEPSGLQNMFNSLGSLITDEDATKPKGSSPK